MLQGTPILPRFLPKTENLTPIAFAGDLPFVTYCARVIIGSKTMIWGTKSRVRAAIMLALTCLFFGLGTGAKAQTVLYQEDFENRGLLIPDKLDNYYSATNPAAGPEYTADAIYLTHCNGWVVQWNDDQTGLLPLLPATPSVDCGTSVTNYRRTQQAAQALGMYAGQSTVAARDNLAVSGYTSGVVADYTATPNAIVIEMKGTNRITMPSVTPPGGTSRFLTVAIDLALANCASAPASFAYSIISGSNADIPVGTTTGSCSFGTGVTPESILTTVAPTYQVGHAIASGNTLYNSSVVGFRIRNTANTGVGNDFAFDNVQILDVSPTLSKSAPGLSYAGQPVTMTFTITNTPGDNQAKVGWAFTDTLPTGLKVASTPNATTTCAAATIAAAAGAGSIAVTAGSLQAGTAGSTASSCTIKVDVVHNATGTTNNVVNNGDATVDNITSSVGLNLALQTVSTEWVANHVTITKVSQGGTGTFAFSGNNGIANHSITTATAGTGVAGVQQTLTAASTTANTTITEAAQPGWTYTGATCTGLAAGQTATVSGNTITLPFAGLSLVSGGRTVACTITNTAIQPLTSVKVSNVYSDPINGTTNPKAIPGAYVDYTIAISAPATTNPATDSIYLFDQLPSQMGLFVNTLAPGPGPAVMNPGTSTLTYTFTSLSSTTDDVDFSNDGGATWTYVPSPDVNGVDSAVTNIRFHPKGTMAAGSTVNFSFRMMVE